MIFPNMQTAMAQNGSRVVPRADRLQSRGVSILQLHTRVGSIYAYYRDVLWLCESPPKG